MSHSDGSTSHVGSHHLCVMGGFPVSDSALAIALDDILTLEDDILCRRAFTTDGSPPFMVSIPVQIQVIDLDVN